MPSGRSHTNLMTQGRYLLPEGHISVRSMVPWVLTDWMSFAMALLEIKKTLHTGKLFTSTLMGHIVLYLLWFSRNVHIAVDYFK